jgi:4-amino-4-deoxy-L-arabinose transferase-like glycosyltransferase
MAVPVKRPAMIATALVLLALLRIASTFRVFSETTDESVHVATGLHLLTQHRYGIQYENPPLIPIVLAGPLLMAGVKYPPDGAYFPLIHAVFYGLPNYKDALFLARAGNLLFFAIAAVATWWWARREIGERAALVALLLFTMEPILLGYSGLATHDAGAVAGVAVSMLALSRWMERRTWARAAVMGLAYGFAILLKFSCIPFVGAAWLVTMLSRLIRERNVRGWVTLTVVPFVTAVVVWAGYGFTIGSSPWVGNGARLPAASFWVGLAGIAKINRAGMSAYAFGQISQDGWWWYFPLAVALKTTLPLLALIIAGAVRARGAVLDAALAGASILAIGMSANLDLGIRYVLAAYV